MAKEKKTEAPKTEAPRAAHHEPAPPPALTERQKDAQQATFKLFQAAEAFALQSNAKKREPGRLKLANTELVKAALNWNTATVLAKREADEKAKADG